MSSEEIAGRRWKLGDFVQKKRGSAWRGRVVGFYETDHTEEGYNVESLFEPGSAQLWPLAALDDWDGTGTPEQLLAHIETLTRELAEAREALQFLDPKAREALALLEETGASDSLVGVWFPDTTKRNGLPIDECAKKARRVTNELRAMLDISGRILKTLGGDHEG